MALIWLPKKKYPNNQTTVAWTSPYYVHSEEEIEKMHFTVVRIEKEYTSKKGIKNISLRYAADTIGVFYINDELVCNNSCKTPEDFVFPERFVKEHYWNNINKDFKEKTNKVVLSALVQMGPTRTYDYSSGEGGFILEGKITYEDDTVEEISSDKSWRIRLEREYVYLREYNDAKVHDDWVDAEEKKNNWKILNAAISLPVEDEISYGKELIIPAGKKRSITIKFPLIYSAFYELEVKSSGNVKGSISTFEVDKSQTQIQFNTVGNRRVRFIDEESCGGFTLEAENESDEEAEVILHVFHSHYPFKEVKHIATNNRKLDDVFEKSLFAMVNCSQTILLDSPHHCEPLASCCGDYYIISLVEAFATGNYDLIKHVLRGHSDLLVKNKGRIANLTYVLVYVNMVWKIYNLTGDKELLNDCLPGVRAVLDLYNTFYGDNGVIEFPYRFCFVDWLVVDGNSLFDPPKSLGQSVTNMFYYRALVAASGAYKEIGEDKLARKYELRAKRLKKAINNVLFDKERGLYIEGLDTPTPAEKNPFNYVQPAVVPGKIYYRKHANVLAVAYGLVNKSRGRRILKSVFGELKDLEIQPYFMHFLFEAIHEVGMDSKYAMKVLKEWTSRVNFKDKGLPEGFYKPTPSYIFDYSHAWGCSPYYSFIVAASGIEILAPGMKKIKLDTKTLGLKVCDYSIGAPYGFIHIHQEKGKEAEIDCPKEIEIVRE